MPSSSKRKGNRYEREVCEEAEGAGLCAERAYASDGRALGESKEVDLVIESEEGERWRVQAKRRGSIAQYLPPPDGADVTVIREDYGDSLTVLPLGVFLDLVSSAQ